MVSRAMVTSEVRTILVIAAESFELKYIRPRTEREWILTANGPGPALAGEAADRVGRGCRRGDERGTVRRSYRET